MGQAKSRVAKHPSLGSIASPNAKTTALAGIKGYAQASKSKAGNVTFWPIRQT